MIFQTFSILDSFPLSSQHMVDPAGHTVALSPAVVLADARDPQDLEPLDQLGGRDKVFVLELPFHVVLHVLNWIQI